MIYRFGVFELDEAAGELRKAGRPVAIQPKPLALLALLIRERDRVVPSNELLERLWPDTIVSPASLNRAVSQARRALDDSGQGVVLKSVSRRGYRFTAPVQEAGHGEGAAATAGRGSAGDRAGSRPAPAPAVEPVAEDGREPFVGRAVARERLARVREIAREGRTAIALVTGPPGIGKTRLAERFAAETERAGFRVVSAACRDRDGVPALWLWTQVLRRMGAQPGYGDEIRELLASGEIAALAHAIRSVAPELFVDDAGDGSAITPDAPDAADEPDPRAQSRFLFFDAAARTLTACARSHPLLLVLEDLQWAGQPSLRMLEHFAAEVADVPLLILATVRQEPRDRGHPVERSLGMLRRARTCEEIDLAGLSRGEVGEFLARAIGRPAPSDLISELYARTEGIPLFLVEATRLLEERGELAHPERIPRHGVTLPARAVDLIQRALDGLSPECTRLLELGAVIGRELVVPTLARVAGVERADVLERLDEAIAVGVLEEVEAGVGRYRFGHALFQETLYDGLKPGARARAHLAVARTLEHRHGEDLEAVLSELAHHHHRSLAVGDPERAFELATRAAHAADQLYAFEETAAHYEQALDALDLCERVDPTRRLRTLLALGEAHRLSGDRPRRLEVFAQALECARALEDAGAFVRAAIGFCDLSEWSAPDPRAPAIVREALACADPEDWVGLARLTTRSAYLVVQRRAEAEPIGRRAALLARKSGDDEALQEALYVLHYVIAGPDGLDERGQLIEELVAAAEPCANRDAAVIAALDLSCDRLMLGDLAGARRFRTRASRLAGDHASPSMRWHQTVWDAGLALLRGDFADAEQRAHDALLLGRRIGHPFARACFNGQIATLDRERGAPERILERLGHTLDNTRLGATHWTRAVVGRAECVRGERERGRALLDGMAEEGFDRLVRNLRWNGTIVEIAHLCADAGAEEHARALIEVLSTAPDQHGLLPIPISYGGPIGFALGRLWALLGLVDDAIPALEEALERATALEARPTALRVRVALAPLHRRGGQRARADELLAGCEDEARALGMPGLAREAAALAAR